MGIWETRTGNTFAYRLYVLIIDIHLLVLWRAFWVGVRALCGSWIRLAMGGPRGVAARTAQGPRAAFPGGVLWMAHTPRGASARGVRAAGGGSCMIY